MLAFDLDQHAFVAADHARRACLSSAQRHLAEEVGALQAGDLLAGHSRALGCVISFEDVEGAAYDHIKAVPLIALTHDGFPRAKALAIGVVSQNCQLLRLEGAEDFNGSQQQSLLPRVHLSGGQASRDWLITELAHDRVGNGLVDAVKRIPNLFEHITSELWHLRSRLLPGQKAVND